MGVGKLGAVEPFFAPQGVKLNGDRYMELLEQQMFPAMALLAHKAGVSPGEYYFQQDNAPSHKPDRVLKCVKRNAKVFSKWPACSYDLAPMDYFVFNEVKAAIEKVQPPPKSEQQMRTAVTLACADLDQLAINRAIDSFVTRCRKCFQVGGLRFEHML